MESIIYCRKEYIRIQHCNGGPGLVRCTLPHRTGILHETGQRTVDISIPGRAGAAANQKLHLQLLGFNLPDHEKRWKQGSTMRTDPFGANHLPIETERRAGFSHGKATEVTAQNRDPAPKLYHAKPGPKVDIAMPHGTRGGGEAVSHLVKKADSFKT